jgi:3-oxoacyl-[acyl-carrier protein] reductase
MVLIQVQKAAPHMAPGSRVILFSTTLCAASTVTPNYLAYVSSKGAIEQMTRVLSKDLARKGIMVNCVAPGPTATEMFLHGKSEQLLKMIAGFSPQERIGKPEEIADVVAFLSGEGARWVTGQTLRVNGGFA